MDLSSAERPALSPPLLYDSYGPRVWVQRRYPGLQTEIEIQIFLIFQTFPQMSQYYLLTSPSIPYRLKCHLYHVLNSQMCLGSICEHTILSTHAPVPVVELLCSFTTFLICCEASSLILFHRPSVFRCLFLCVF